MKTENAFRPSGAAASTAPSARVAPGRADPGPGVQPAGVPSIGPRVAPSLLWRSETVLAQARMLLADARAERAADDQFRIAHLAALRGTAALLAVLTPGPGSARRRPTSAWVLLERALPEFAAWATFFAAGQGRRAAADAGVRGAVSSGEAVDLLAATARFLDLVEAGVTEATLRGGRADAPTLVAALGPLESPPERTRASGRHTGLGHRAEAS